MPGPVLLDVNVLVALFDADHVHHDFAHDWFAEAGQAAWATCAVTESGCLRILTNPAYHGGNLRPDTMAALLRRFCAAKGHRFWRDSVSLLDQKMFDLSYVRGFRQLTDAYLLGLACREGGRLATFDRSIPLKAVVGATRDHVALIEPAP